MRKKIKITKNIYIFTNMVVQCLKLKVIKKISKKRTERKCGNVYKVCFFVNI